MSTVTGPTPDHLISRRDGITTGFDGARYMTQLVCTCGARTPYLAALPSPDRWAATVHPRPRRSLTGALSDAMNRILAAALTRKEIRHA